MESTIYLDHAATTFPDERVILSMAECMRCVPYNASAAYSAAGESRQIHRKCRKQISAMLHCPPENLFFTSGGTESNNWVIQSFAGKHMTISAIEHHSILHAAHHYGSSVTLIKPDETGYIHPEAVENALQADTKLVCLQAANNETGVIHPIQEVYSMTKLRGIHLHVDAVQAFGHIPLHTDCCDSMSISAHKLYGPRGIGALYIRSGASIRPLLYGGGQESGLRAGTENTPAVRGFHIAAELSEQDMDIRAERERRLLDAFADRICLNIPGAKRLGENRKHLPGICALYLPHQPAERIIAALDLQGILISGGAACASSSGQPSHVYTAMGLNTSDAACVIRVSIGRHTTQEELLIAAQAIEDLILQPAH